MRVKYSPKPHEGDSASFCVSQGTVSSFCCLALDLSSVTGTLPCPPHNPASPSPPSLLCFQCLTSENMEKQTAQLRTGISACFHPWSRALEESSWGSVMARADSAAHPGGSAFALPGNCSDTETFSTPVPGSLLA